MCYAKPFILSLLLIAGCGGDSLVTVSGKVTYDGEPIQDGRIDFQPEDNQGPTAGASIINGTYSVQTSKGKKVVNVTATKVTEWRLSIQGNPNSKKVPLKSEPLVPKKYNSPSELRYEVTGPATKDFDLKP